MAELASNDLTPELLHKLDRALAEILDNGPDCDPAAILLANGVGLIDRDRGRCLVDERVYEGALFRSRRWAAMALAYLKPAEIKPPVWHDLKGTL